MVKRKIFNKKILITFTIILWSDGIKTVVKCNKEDEFDKEKGLAMAIVKRLSGNKGNYYNIFKEFCK